MSKHKEEAEEKTCSCTQAAVDLLRGVSPVKEGMLREAEYKSCGKTFWTNREVNICMDCESKR
jgi:hypothetical protein